MNESNSSLASILAAPWQQRRNTVSRLNEILVVAMCFVVPLSFLVVSLFAPSAQEAALQRGIAARSAWIGIFALMVAGWLTLVGNTLQQNHPTLARLVPHHASQLRTALLVAWAMVSLAAAAIPGFGFDAPLAWACGAAGALALLAAALRWPMLWLCGVAAPFVSYELTSRFGAADFEEAIRTHWEAHQVVWAGMIVTAGASILVGVIGNGGARHRGSYEYRQRLRSTFFASQRDGAATLAISKYVWLGGAATNGRPYHWWLDRLLARRDSPVMARLFAGLGPATHWTSRLFEAFWFLVIISGVCVLVSVLFGGALQTAILPWMAFSVLTNGCSNALLAVPRLHRTHREQALLVLLPGVPRGARLNRWLGWQLSISFVVTALCGLLLAWVLEAFADTIAPGVVTRATGGMTMALSATMLPQVAWQWRRWAGMRSSAGIGSMLPVLVSVLMGVALLALHAGTGVGYLPVGIALAILALAYCAWRWHRMADEPTALPVGRLA